MKCYNEEPANEVKYRGFKLEYYQDEDPYDPMDDDGMMATFVCGAREYKLGHFQLDERYRYASSMEEVYLNWLYDNGYVPHMPLYQGEEDLLDEKSLSKVRKWANENTYWQPLFLYDHSGLTIATHRFMQDSAGWDTSLIGFVFFTKKHVKELYEVKKVTKEIWQRAINELNSDVAHYAEYLEGNVYFVLVKVDKESKESKLIKDNWNHEIEESLGGIYYSDMDYYENEFKDEIDKYYQKELHNRCERTKSLILKKVPIEYR